MPTPRSSNIDQIAYDPTTLELEVTFKTGDTYQYTGVPAELARAFQRAPSHGEFLHRRIKPAYPYSKL